MRAADPVSKVAGTVLALTMTAVLPSQAAHAEIFAFGANASNTQLHQIFFDPAGPRVEVLNTSTDQSSHNRLEGLVVVETAAGQLNAFAVDSNGNKVLFYADLLGGSLIDADIVWQSGYGPGPATPTSAAITRDGSLIVTEAGGSASATSKLWVFPSNAGCTPASPLPDLDCLPGAVRAPRLIDDDVRALNQDGSDAGSVRNVEEVFVHTESGGLVSAGDVSVVGSAPSTVLTYPGSAVQAIIDGTASGPVAPVALVLPNGGAGNDCAREFAAGTDAAGITSSPLKSEILVSTTGGVIQRWGLDGVRVGDAANCSFADFASGLGQGKYGLGAVVDGTQSLVGVANNNGGNYLLFEVNADGSGTQLPAVVTAGVQAPRAIDFSTLRAVESGTAGSTQLITLNDLDFFEQSGLITESGVSGVQTCWGLDPRERADGSYDARVLNVTELEGTCNLPFSSLTIGPELRVIPNSAGEHRLVVVIVSSTAQVDGLITSSLFIEGLTDAPQNCDDDLTGGAGMRPRIGYSLIDELGEGTNLEGTTTDNTVQCNRARSASRSAFFGPLYVDQSIKSLKQQAQDKQQSLCTVINTESSCLARRDQRSLKKQCNSLGRQIGRGKYPAALATAESLAIAARDASFPASCAATLQEDIIVRALGTAFSIYDGLLHPDTAGWIRYDFPEDAGFIPILQQ